jgi:hypothetical protein
MAVLGAATYEFLCSRERTPVSSHRETALVCRGGVHAKIKKYATHKTVGGIYIKPNL